MKTTEVYQKRFVIVLKPLTYQPYILVCRIVHEPIHNAPKSPFFSYLFRFKLVPRYKISPRIISPSVFGTGVRKSITEHLKLPSPVAWHR